MKTYLVETTGPFQLVDFTNQLSLVHAHRPSVALMTPFLQGRVALEQVRLLGVLDEDLLDEATDEEFDHYWDENQESAVDAFLASYGDQSLSEKSEPKSKKVGKEPAKAETPAAPPAGPATPVTKDDAADAAKKAQDAKDKAK